MARYLRGKAELPRGVRIRWILDPNLAAQGFNGSCEDFDSADRFEIRIASQLSANHCWDCLAHELGHIRQRIFHPDEVDDHGDGFGVEFARLWRSVVGEG